MIEIILTIILTKIEATDSLPQNIQKFKNEKLNKSNVEKIINRVLEYYANRGYPFCTVKPQITIKKDSATLTLNIEKGKKFIVKKISSKNIKIKEERLKKFFNTRNGEIFTYKKIKMGRNKLLKYSFSYDSLKLTQNGEIFFYFRKSSKFKIILGYYKEIFLNLQYQDKNFLNYLFPISIEAEKMKDYTSIEADFYLPYIFRNLTFHQILNYKIWKNDSVNMTLDFNFSLLYETPSFSPFWGFRLFSENYKNKYSAQTGVKIFTKFFKNKTEILFSKKLEKFFNAGDLHFGKNVFAQIKFIFGKINTPFDFDVYYIGGLKNLRGFKEMQFSSKDFKIFNIEVGKILNQYLKFLIFYDKAIFEESHYGYGAGLLIDSKNYFVGIWLGIPDGNFKDSKIHSSLTFKF